MKISYKNYIYEAVQIPTRWYHGTDSNFDKFDINYAHNEEKSLAKFGPGFYLTQDIEIAKHYGNTIKVVELTNTSKVYSGKSKPKLTFATVGVNNIPESRKEYILSDWDENPVIAKNKLINFLMNQKTLDDQVQAIWYECFRRYEIEFMTIFSKKCDGILFEMDGKDVLVAYNPEVLNIVETINI